MHVNEYVYIPWSTTPLRIFFTKHKSVPGSFNSVNTSKLLARKNVDEVVTKAFASANLRVLVQFAQDASDEVSIFSIDTGMSDNIFTGRMFDLNDGHVEGKYLNMTMSDS